MKILVTGGAGFIGSNFVRRTLQDAYPGLEGAEVIVLDALTYSGNLANLAPVADSPRYSFIHGDIRDSDLLDDVLPGVDGVVHFAAESHVDRSVRDASVFVETNVLGTQRVLDAAMRADVGRFVHVSTDEVYGSIATGSWDESQPLEPNSPYSASKAGSDLMARSYFRTHGMNLSITRCSNNYGPFHFPEKVIPLFVTNLIDDKHVPLYGQGNNVRDWLHVDDHTRGIAMVLTGGRAGEIYNIGGGTELSNLELTQLLLDATDRDWSYVDRVPDRLGHDLRYSVDIGKIRAELGYEPLVSFAQGLADVLVGTLESPRRPLAFRPQLTPLRELPNVAAQQVWCPGGIRGCG
jgi:dTDP-glucose 4,6-dehydratase